MPEVQASVKQIDLSGESADPGDSFKVFSPKPSDTHPASSCGDHQCVYTDISNIHTEQRIESHLPSSTSIQAKSKRPPDSSVTIQANLSNGHQDEVTGKKQEVTTSTVPRKKLNRILTSLNKPYLYIAEGDFSIVWPNVIVFTLASILYIVATHTVITVSDITLHKTWIFCKLTIN